MANNWNAAEAKIQFSELLDASESEPQIILRHGKPAGVVISWERFQERRGLFSSGLNEWLGELADISGREGDFDTLPRADRRDFGDIIE